MKKAMKTIKYFSLIILINLSGVAWGQQMPDFTLYNNNMLLMNSAYAGITDGLSFTAGYRRQWAGFDGAPGVFSFAGHGYIPKFKVGVGATGWQYEAGAFKQTALFTDYSYRLQFEKFTLNLGFQAGIINHRTSYANADLNGLNDPLFNTDVNQTNFNTGGGVFLYGDKFYMGFSAPILITYQGNDNDQIKMDQHFILTGGYLFDMNEKMVLKPHALLKMVTGSPVTYNVGVSAYYAERVGLGLLFKSQQTMAITVDVNFNKSFYVGYGYDLKGGSDIAAAQNGSHEIMLNYILPAKGGKNEKVRYY
jgi:type IX secretion system PorP/SprF family membrane protein